ncbi:hypothetical protein EIK56_09320 [Sphingomonas sp. C8-2]|jgi:hypothetical protein|uniref:Uncharacterized protein n=1 Tax=Rhizorhabdus histidinilytica TaxID=439228 RepID=A0A1T5A1J2_9SPHN|nr:hypothetical protein [Rhizorhabdus histidinilytica]QEH78345.1 hypothetical protein EIK56_09320 [Sphingomonas sp. C8-2]SKB28891.1 hypothetical protein SAMN06295920_101481 [Rhizorhabdus histidinilytica]
MPSTLGTAIETATGCPRGRSGEIVVCRRGNASERYRIPEALRPDGFDFHQQDVDGVSRERHRLMEGGEGGIGSCSPSGAAGASGCLAQKFRAWEQQKAGH